MRQAISGHTTSEHTNGLAAAGTREARALKTMATANFMTGGVMVTSWVMNVDSKLAILLYAMNVGLCLIIA